MKKILSICLALVLAISLLSAAALADGPAIRVGSLEADPGDTVTVEVSLENNPGIMAFVLGIDYDQTRLEKVKFSHTGLQGLWAMQENAVWVGSENSTYEGVFLKLKFRVLEDAPGGDAYVTILCGDGAICNYDEEEIDFAVISGGVTVSGDVESGGETAPTDAPEATEKPESTKAPESTDKPEATEKPQNTEKPESTDKPENTDKPDATEKPRDDGEPVNTPDEGPALEEPAADEPVPAEKMSGRPVAAEEAAAQPVASTEDGVPEDEPVFAEASDTAPDLIAGENPADGGRRSGLLLGILALGAAAVVLIVVIIVMVTKNGSYRRRH